MGIPIERLQPPVGHRSPDMALKDLPCAIDTPKPVEHRRIDPDRRQVILAIEHLARAKAWRRIDRRVTNEQVVIANGDAIAIRIDDVIGGVPADPGNEIGIIDLEEVARCPQGR